MPLSDDQKLRLLEHLKSTDFFGSDLSLRPFSRNLSNDAHFGPDTFTSIYCFTADLRKGFRSGRHPLVFKENKTYDLLKKTFLAKNSPASRISPRPAASTKAVRNPTKPKTPSADPKEPDAKSNIADFVKTIREMKESQDASTVRFETKLKEQSEAIGLLTQQNEKLIDVIKALIEETKKTTTIPVKQEVVENIQAVTARAKSVPRRGGEVAPPEEASVNRGSARSVGKSRRATGFDDVFIDRVTRAADLTHFPRAVRVKNEEIDGNVFGPAEEFNAAQQAHGRHEGPQD